MNTLTGQISTIEVNGSLALITTRVNDVFFTAIIVETPETASYLKLGATIKVLFKETEVIIATQTPEYLSLQNKVIGQVTQVDKGVLLSKLVINTSVGDIVSVITTKAVNQLGLTKGNHVTAMIKTNEILLSE
ncbi:tobe domain protein [Aquimarina sp. AD10]|uniref:Tobe domain protein n=1 Tax=Aquimarina aggregata TaxID=1642818 RepID=A0A162WGJ4_9FLAO|nr:MULTISPECIES: TOBE domain-containing protein [Aquimarina]AXT61619.1 tobe domain protein [Aquimarina sp. AD10]KZS38083.1 tobe domain protein [Aquimarina aggregata]RKN01032.1 tobe domain protein [Aquimarina sp. AD10]